jgi:hypothetical protein
VHDASRWEEVGIPTVVVATTPFRATVEATADLIGFAGLRVVYAPHPVSRLDEPGFDRLADELFDEVAGLLGEPA